MLKLLIITLFLFAFVLPIQSQSIEINRLKNSLLRQQVDSVKVDLLNEMSFASRKLNRDSMAHFIHQAKTIASSIGYDAGMARAINLEAMLLISKNNYRKSIDFNNKALEIARKTKNDLVIFQIYNSIGYAHFMMMEYEKSVEAFQSCEFFTRKSSNDTLLCSTLISIINNYIEQNNFERAEQYLITLEKLANRLGSEELLSHVSYKYGQIYYRKREFKTSLLHFSVAIENTARQIGNQKKAKQEIIRLLIQHSKKKEARSYMHKVQLI